MFELVFIFSVLLLKILNI